jgi:hypothetical protein
MARRHAKQGSRAAKRARGGITMYNASKRRLPVIFAIAGLLVMAVALTARAQTREQARAASSGSRAATGNPPWYPSLEAFEHYNSGRSHVFPLAKFDGSWDRPNRVDIVASPRGQYPSGYNMAYLNAHAAFIYGGGYGNVKGSIGPFVAKVNPNTLRPIWYTQLRNTRKAHEWDYPGAIAIENDGFIYAVSGYHIWKVNPASGKVVKTLTLPTVVHNRDNYPNSSPTYYKQPSQDATNTSYNGINALPDGTIIVKSLYRTAGCPLQGPAAILNCNQSQNIPASVLISVNPRTMRIIDNITLPAFAGARPTITQYHGVDYVYLLEKIGNPVRYAVTNGHFTLDTSWTPDAIATNGDGSTAGGSLIVINDWIVGATNTVPATASLTMFAINQGDAHKVFTLHPYAGDPVAPELQAVFSPSTSWADMSLEADAANNLVYGVETLARKVAAFTITNSGIQMVWEKTQTTTEWATLIGPKNHRVWVSTDIPGAEIPGRNASDVVVWRDAATGRELARSGRVPVMTQGSAIQPGYGGSVFFPSAKGTLYKLTPHPVG